MSRKTFYLSHEITNTELCPECHHMTIEHIETTIIDDDGVNGTVPIRTQCDHCHPEDEE